MTTRRAFASLLASGVMGLALALPSLSRRPALPERPIQPVYGPPLLSPLEFESWVTPEQKAIWDAVAAGKGVRIGHGMKRVAAF